jgi:hypothetical protein
VAGVEALRAGVTGQDTDDDVADPDLLEVAM